MSDGTIFIPLTQGKIAEVDLEDWDKIRPYKWHAVRTGEIWYAYCRATRQGLHQLIQGKQEGKVIDHKDRNGLNNHRNNLRFATHSQNHWNRGKCKNNTSGYKGVSWDKQMKKWRAQITFQDKRIYLCLSHTKEEAARAYNKAAIELHGDFAMLNEVPQ